MLILKYKFDKNVSLFNYQYIYNRQMSFSEQNYNSSNKKKITPILQFSKGTYCKSPPKFDSRVSDRADGTKDKCANHPAKNAQYVSQASEDDESIFYCERCAILLASQGFNVIKIRNKSSNNRKDQIDTFLKKIKILSEDIKIRKEQAREILINSEQFYGEQIQEINEYFNLVYQSLELEKNKCYNYILNERKNAEESTRKMTTKINYLSEEVCQIIQDIEESLNIVEEIQQKAYRPVIISYQNKLNHYQEIFNTLVLDPVEMRKIEFAGVPDSIYSLSEILIKNSSENIQHLQSPSLTANDKINSMMFSFQGDHAITGQSEETLRGYLKMWD